ncbi:MAG: tetratricopeptide repeat protein [Acidobacteria bacterium]|nr:tetratricopeptide repeat protein [Acidobacteriota bacterium]
MSKNLLLCVIGIVVGFTVGFFITNAVTKPVAGGGTAARAASPSGDARPLSPDQMGGELPPGHPSVDSDAGGGGSAASTSAAAQAAMEKADRSPKDFAAQTEAARVFYGLHDYDKAALYAERALKLKGTDFDTLVLMGNARYDAKDFAAAAGFYERALAVKPASPDVRTDLGNTHFNRGDYDRALAEYRKSLAVDPGHVNSWRNIAAAALQKGDKKAAEEAVAQLSRLSPQSQELEAYRQRIAQMP